MSKQKQLMAFLDNLSAEQSFSGMVRITLKDNVIFDYSVGFANSEKKLCFDENSVFTFYSLTKPFTAIGVMKLVDRGLVDLEVHPRKYVPEMAGFDDGLKVKHLLTHTSGLPDFEFENELKESLKNGAPEFLREQLAELKKCDAYFPAGKDYRYANINFSVLALIIENVSEKSFAEYMKSEVFLPLGMENAQIDFKGLQVENRVQGYCLNDGKLTPCERETDWVFGGGDAIGTIDDVYCLNHAIKHKKLLSEEGWKQILTPNEIGGLGFGCAVNVFGGKTRIQHSGGFTGFRTFHIQILEDDFDIIILANSGFGMFRLDITDKIFEIFYETNGDKIKLAPMDVGYAN